MTTNSSGLFLSFVYGTLKRGENNYDPWLADPKEATFVSRARTQRRYPFFINLAPNFKGCSPCVLNHPDYDDRCQQVQGELFLVTPKMKAWLDVLEAINAGIYTIEEIPIEVLDDWADISSLDLQPFYAGEDVNGRKLVRAIIYFRIKQYPEDWAAEHPKDSSTFISDYKAAEMLKQYGYRFLGHGAHLKPANGKAMQEELNELPAELQPPTSVEPVDPSNTESYYGAPLRPAPIVLFIIDGVGDNTYPELGNRTPLEVVAGAPPRATPGEGSVQQHSTPSLWEEAEKYNAAHLTENPYLPADLRQDGPPSLRQRYTAFYRPSINAIARRGVNGLLDPYEAGQSCGSDTAHLSLFGYPPKEYYRGRGAYEALGAGLMLGEGDIAFKSNFSTQFDPAEEPCNNYNFLQRHPGQTTAEVAAGIEASWAKEHPPSGDGSTVPPPPPFMAFRRCDREFTKEGPILCEYLNNTVIDTDVDGVAFPFKHTLKLQYATEHRCGLSITEGIPNEKYDPNADHKYAKYTSLQGQLSDQITGTDPLKDDRFLLWCEPKKDTTEPLLAAYTSLVVNAASQVITQRLKVHPINEERRQHNRNLSTNTTNATKEEYKNIANNILFRGAAKKGFVPLFSVRHGLQAAIIAPTCIIKGLGVCCGMTGYNFPPANTTTPDEGKDPYTHRGRATGDFYSDVDVKIRAVREILRLGGEDGDGDKCSDAKEKDFTYHKTNFVVLHVKGVDDAGHDKHGFQKLYYLTKCAHIIESLLPPEEDEQEVKHTDITKAPMKGKLPAGSVFAVLADHSTPLYIGDHCCEPVPFAACVVGEKKTMRSSGLVDKVQLYGEGAATEGSLGRFRGEEVIPLLKKLKAHYHYAK